MSWIAWIVCAVGVALVAGTAIAEERKPVEVKPAKKPDPTERVLNTLASECILKDGIDPKEAPLIDLLRALGKQYDVNFVLNEDSFKEIGEASIREEKTTASATSLNGLTVHQFLATTLESMGATYLVRNGSIEVVPVAYAAKVTKAKVGPTEGVASRPYLEEPLVSAIIKEKPLNEVVEKIAEMYDLTATVGPQAADAKTGFVTARLLNVPADKALELLALQCDLRVVRRGTAYYITSKDHANELFNEKLDQKRQKIEVQKLKDAPLMPPAPIPPAPPEKPAGNAFQGFGPLTTDPWFGGRFPIVPNRGEGK